MTTTITIPNLTDCHAAATAAVVPGGRQLTFRNAVREARYYPEPYVLQQRDESGAVLSAMAVVPGSINMTSGDDGQGQVDVLLWLPAYGSTAARWSEQSMTVAMGTVVGTNWHTVEPTAAIDAQAVVDAAVRAADDANAIPRTAEAAQHRARILRLYGAEVVAAQLDALAAWLPGGERNAQGHALAADLDLCGEYEAAVCPTLGWLPRRGAGNSRAALTRHWEAEVAALESAYRGDSSGAIRAALERVERGGVVNRAIVEHAAVHLEQHKRPGVNALLDDLGMDTIETTRTYSVEVRVERSRTVTEYAYVTVEVEADDEDGAAELATERAADEANDGYVNWTVEDDCYDCDITDTEVESVELS